MQERSEPMSTDRRQLKAFVLFAVAGGCAFILMFCITPYGPGVSPDSVRYIETARSLLAGSGFYVQGQPMSHYPPFYPLLLAIVGTFQHNDVLEAGRLLCAFFFSANFALFGLSVFICTDRSLLATGCAMCFFLASAPIISIHSMAWSEAPLIAFAMAAFVLLSLHVVRPSVYLLLAASLSVGCAMLTRYVGVSLLPPIVCGLLFCGDRPLKRKIYDTLISVAIASLPLAFWLIRNFETAGTATNRTFAIHVFGLHHAKQLVWTMCNFVLPISIFNLTGALQLRSVWAFFLVSLFIFLLSLALLHRKNYIRRNANTVHIVLPFLCMVFFLTYIVFLVISISFFDALTPLDDRVLLPAFLTLTVAVISLAWSLSSASHRRIIWYGFIFFLCFSFAINSHGAVGKAVDIHKKGTGYTSRRWKHSETIACVRSIAPDVKIYSNGPEAIQFLTERKVTRIPDAYNPHTLKPNQDFQEQLQAMCTGVREGKAIIVYFNGMHWRRSLLPIQELEEWGAMPVLGMFNDGAIYGRLKR
jgi:hypothetical protein